ncbi:MAG TPA: cysteine desulfurase family protein [Chthonomonadales bacterium]|nr:cysteine desulfurase family protein [Chthonomonadales bacterium]
MELPIYLDHAATTPVLPEVLEEMLPYFADVFANPATLYASGLQAREAVEEARETIAQALGADASEIYFTSGGTESDNWAIKGMALASGDRRHLLTTPIEHHAVLDSCLALEKQGYEVEFLPVDSEGFVDPEDVAQRIRPDTFLVSVMHANNEVGTIEPIQEIGKICHEKNVKFHSDGVQSFGNLPIIDVNQLHVDLLTLSAHKLYGPKGIGALYIRRGTRIARFMDGGEQEKGRRAGTLNVPAIVGFGSAVRRMLIDHEAEARRLTDLRDRLIDGVLAEIPDARLSGPRKDRLPNNAHFCFGGVEGESLLLSLEMSGIYASAGSACTAGSTEPSHVLLAMGVPVEWARGALRMTLGRSTTAEAIDYTIERLAEVVQDLRRLRRVAVAG